jgi:hypothetical protein
MGILLWLLKPVIYAVMLAIGAGAFARSGPHHARPAWLIVALATAARVALGMLGGIVAYGIAGPSREAATLLYSLLFACGLVSWFVTAKVAFRKASVPGVLAFALAAELLSMLINWLAIRFVGSINFC